MYKIDFLRKVANILNLSDDFDVYNRADEFDIVIQNMDQVRAIRSSFHGFFDDYYDNNYYKENVDRIQSVFNKIDNILGIKNTLDDIDNPVNQFLYGDYSKQELENKFLFEMFEIITNETLQDDQHQTLIEEFNNSGLCLIDLVDQLTRQIFDNLTSELNSLYSAVQWE